MNVPKQTAQHSVFPAAAVSCIAGVLILLYPMRAYLQEEPLVPDAEQEEKEFSRYECRWAIRWVNREMDDIMASGAVEKIKAKDDLYAVWVGEPWYDLPFSRRGVFLQKLSRAREITGHDPFFTLRDSETEAVAASVGPDGITIVLPEEGTFQYLFDATDKDNTYY